jgi:hypothetical protein
MKRFYIYACVALFVGWAVKLLADGYGASRQFTTTNSSATAPVQVKTNSTPFRYATVLGKKAERTDNTGIVYIGVISTNDTQPYAIAPGGSVTIQAPPGCFLDFKDWYLDVVTANDGVVVIYTWQ